MSLIAERVFNEANALAIDERISLIESLIAGLPTVDDEPSEEWKVEIRRRSAEFDAGGMTPVPWSEVKRQVMGE